MKFALFRARKEIITIHGRAKAGGEAAASGRDGAVIYDEKSMVTRLIRDLHFDGLFLEFCVSPIRRTPECN